FLGGWGGGTSNCKGKATATARATANANAGVSPLRFASVEMTVLGGWGGGGVGFLRWGLLRVHFNGETRGLHVMGF
ncbi:MAG TPA: hypothetical protein VGN01_11180, partial [Acidobacteriaceae bacterium]